MLKIATLILIAVTATVPTPGAKRASQPPVPSRTEQSSPVQQPSKGGQQNTSENARTSANGAPALNTPNTKDSEQKTEWQDDYQQREATAKDARVIGVTSIVVGALQTIALFVTFLIIAFVAVRQLRAYVSVNPKRADLIETKPFTISITKTGNWIADFEVKNVGQTPAFKVIGEGFLDILPEPLPERFPFHYPVNKLIKSETVLFPQQTVNIVARTHTPFSRQQIADIQRDDSGKALYGYGIVNYRDAFGFNRKTRYSVVIAQLDMMVAIASARGPYKMDVVTVSLTASHNDAT